jgi:methylated-DNA-[protein]-cysteine S-methyltransferase
MNPANPAGQYDVPGWGIGELRLLDGAVLGHVLPCACLSGIVGSADPEPAALPVVEHALVSRFRAHLAGERVDYDDVEIVLDGYTPLQQALAAALRGIPWGETVTYGELAALAGRPQAPRAAGAFCAANQIALIVPCHRVVASTGIGSYGDGARGVELKRRLLALEGVRL